LNKRIDTEQVAKTIELTSKAGIAALIFLIMGNPGETIATINTTYRFAKKLKCEAISWGIMQIYPGTALARMQPQKDFVAYLYAPEVDQPCLCVSANIPVFENPGLDREQLKQIRKNILRKTVFFKILSHPGYAVKKFTQTPLTALKIIKATFLGG
jgi:hypothetical protein